MSYQQQSDVFFAGPKNDSNKDSDDKQKQNQSPISYPKIVLFIFVGVVSVMILLSSSSWANIISAHDQHALSFARTTTRKDCPAGRYNDFIRGTYKVSPDTYGDCIICPVDNFCLGGSDYSSCTPKSCYENVGKNSFTNYLTGAKSVDACLCKHGFFFDANTKFVVTVNTKCLPCAGSNSASPIGSTSSSQCVLPTAKCPVGRFSDSGWNLDPAKSVKGCKTCSSDPTCKFFFNFYYMLYF